MRKVLPPLTQILSPILIQFMARVLVDVLSRSKIRIRILLLALFLSVSVQGSFSLAAENVFRIASWNIADFHHKAGFEARRAIGTKRYSADFKVLQKYAVEIDSDIIALQEIVTEEAARLLFPVEHYWLFMSSRYKADKQTGVPSDIYTALVVRKGVGITPVRQSDLNSLEIKPEKSSQFERSTRRGTAVLLDIKGDSVWVMSVHLKSSCATVKKIEKSRQRACKVLWKQALLLKRWITGHLEEGSDFIIAGDFNRRFGRLKNKGNMWRLLSQLPTDSAVSRFPLSKLRLCPTRKGKGVHPIDWFVVNAEFAKRFHRSSYFETRWSRAEVSKHRNRLSDHCPIHIEFSSAT